MIVLTPNGSRYSRSLTSAMNSIPVTSRFLMIPLRFAAITYGSPPWNLRIRTSQTSAAGGTLTLRPLTVYVKCGQKAAVNLEPSSSVGNENVNVLYKSELPPAGIYLVSNGGLV